MLQKVEQHLTEIRTLQEISGARNIVSGWTDGLDGLRSVSVFAQFVYGGGGESVELILQTSIDGGETPIDIGRIVFEKTSKIALCNISADNALGWFEPKALKPAESVNILGDRLRYKLSSKGIYENTSLRVYFAPR